MKSNDNLDELKSSFLAGNISAAEYERRKNLLDSNTTDENSKTGRSTGQFIIISILVAVVGIILILILNPKKEITKENELTLVDSTAMVKSDTPTKEEIEIEKKRVKEIEAEERAFLKTKAGRIWKKHPEWSKEDCKNLADGKIWIGMDYNMLKYKRGLPNSANPSNYGNGTQWQWCWHDWTPSCFYDTDGDGKIDSYN